jgi:uncharacterized protein (DUF1684 family)
LVAAYNGRDIERERGIGSVRVGNESFARDRCGPTAALDRILVQNNARGHEQEVMTKWVALLIGIFCVLVVPSAAQKKNYANEIKTWRGEHETSLKKDNGWLTVVGLFWLKDGTNTVGSGDGYDVELTSNFKGGRFGDISFHDGKAVLTVAPGREAISGGKPFSSGELVSDDPGKPTIITTGSQSFYLIKREERYGIRLKDSNSEARSSFTHLDWYPADTKYRVTAKFEKYASPKEVLIPNILGGNFKMKAPGLLKFKINGRSVSLEPVVEEGEEDTLFIIFRDQTSRTTTYAAGRFLYADMPKGDTTILDFNKAENPPCAFTTFATCPLPPQQNRLDIAIPAGEKRYAHAAKH